MALAAQPFSNTSAKTSCKLRSAQNVKYNSVNRSGASSRTLERFELIVKCLASTKRGASSPVSHRRNLSMRGPTQPDPTQFNPTRPNSIQPNPTPWRFWEAYILWNGLTGSRAVFFVWCHHSMYFVIWPTPIPACSCHGTWHVPS